MQGLRFRVQGVGFKVWDASHLTPLQRPRNSLGLEVEAVLGRTNLMVV